MEEFSSSCGFIQNEDVGEKKIQSPGVIFTAPPRERTASTHAETANHTATRTCKADLIDQE